MKGEPLNPRQLHAIAQHWQRREMSAPRLKWPVGIHWQVAVETPLPLDRPRGELGTAAAVRRTDLSHGSAFGTVTSQGPWAWKCQCSGLYWSGRARD
jgi:hypothetical protein